MTREKHFADIVLLEIIATTIACVPLAGIAHQAFYASMIVGQCSVKYAIKASYANTMVERDVVGSAHQTRCADTIK